jgi:hypothetical protein
VERISIHALQVFFVPAYAKGFIRLHRLIGAIFIGRCIFMVALSSIRSHWLDDAPAVTVSAEWLRDFGFEVGCRVVIEVSQGVITIKKVDCEDEI